MYICIYIYVYIHIYRLAEERHCKRVRYLYIKQNNSPSAVIRRLCQTWEQVLIAGSNTNSVSILHQTLTGIHNIFRNECGN